MEMLQHVAVCRTCTCVTPIVSCYPNNNHNIFKNDKCGVRNIYSYVQPAKSLQLSSFFSLRGCASWLRFLVVNLNPNSCCFQCVLSNLQKNSIIEFGEPPVVFKIRVMVMRKGYLTLAITIQGYLTLGMCKINLGLGLGYDKC